jgi:hypothetical protein
MPKLIVAHTMCSAPRRQSSCVRERACGESEPWNGAQRMPTSASKRAELVGEAARTRASCGSRRCRSMPRWRAAIECAMSVAVAAQRHRLGRTL